jgi:O-antigen/teichoic acid export membrane protein
VVDRWLRLPDPVLFRDMLWVAMGQVLRIGVQAVYFVLIARALGARDYGAYAGVLAIVAIAAPFASLGTGSLLIKHVSRDRRQFPVLWGTALVTTLCTGLLLLGLVLGVARFVLPASIPLQLVLVIGAADLIFVRLVDIGAQSYQAHDRLSRTAVLQLLLSPLRLGAAVILIAMTPAPTALQWGWVYLASAAVGGGIAVILVSHELGRPEFHLRHLGTEWREGTFFAITLSAQSATNDIDKVMLARLASLEAAGVYAAAYRLVDVAFLPVGALLVAAYSRFFQHGVRGMRATASYGRRLLGVGAAYGLFAAAGLYFVAPGLPALLGQEYEQAVGAVRLLAVLPLLKAIHYFGADALTGAGYQGLRTLVLVVVAALNVLLNLWLIPLYSWRGAALATVLADGLLALAIWAAVWYLARDGKRIGGSPETPSVVEIR